MGQIVAIQVLRALAAATVVIGHAQADARVAADLAGLGFTPSALLPWGAGVDLFFVISGFIMVHASARFFAAPGGRRAFLARRVARIAPLYWGMATLYLASSLAAGKALPDSGAILASYLFLPSDGFGDGVPRPFYTLGWTLNYEMAFYGVFAAALAWQRERAVAVVVGALGLAVLLGALSRPSLAPLVFWSRPIVLEFALGMGLALALARGWRLDALAGWLVAGAGLAALHLDGLDAGAKAVEWITPNDLPRVLCWGVPTALLVAAAVLAPALPQGRAVRALAALGDASYALYLTHPFVIVAGRKLWLASGLAPVLGFWPLVAAMLAAAVALALAVHRLVERPLVRAAQGWLTVGEAPLPRPAAA